MGGGATLFRGTSNTNVILQNPALMATKTSVLIFYLRLFKDTQFVLKYWSWALLMIVNVAGVILTFINIFRGFLS